MTPLPQLGITVVAPHLVVKEPATYLRTFINHHTMHLPDLSEGPDKGPQDKDLGYWLQNPKTRHRLAQHSVMPGLCATRVHTAIDFAMSQGFQCVQFDRDGRQIDQTVPFILAMWVCYLAQMEGRPHPETLAAQNILHYLLNHKKRVARSWRKRQQMYSSG